MKPIPLFATLVLNRGDLLLRLFDSIKYPIEMIVIVNNGNDPSVAEAIEKISKERHNVIVFKPEKNLGVSGGWNWVLQNFNPPWYFIAGNDVMFTEGDLEKMVAEAWANHESMGMFFGNQGHNAYIMTRLAVDIVGLYDENFYPAYLEDCDYMWRMHLAGVSYVDVQDCHIIHGEAPTWGSHTIYSNPVFRTLNGITHSNGYNYYTRKWGGSNGGEVYRQPFNDPNNAPSHWVLDPEWRKLNDIWGI